PSMPRTSSTRNMSKAAAATVPAVTAKRARSPSSSARRGSIRRRDGPKRPAPPALLLRKHLPACRTKADGATERNRLVKRHLDLDMMGGAPVIGDIDLGN